MECTEAADVGQVLAEAVAKIHRRSVGCAIHQTIDQLDQHQGPQQELRDLPYQQEHQHPHHAQYQGLVLHPA
jgi:hypothetical protein